MSKKKKNNNTKLILMFLFICIIAVILLIVEIRSFVDKSNKMKNSQEPVLTVAEEPKEEEPELKFDSFIQNKVFKNGAEIEKLTNKEIKDISINSYNFLKLDYLEMLDSANSASNAVENTKDFIKGRAYNHFVDECKLIKEEDLFYGVNIKYKAVSENHDNYFSSNYLIPKTDFYNSNKNTLNMDDSTRAKKMLDIMEYMKAKSNGGKALIQSFFNREDDGYHYVVYYVSSIYSESLNEQVYSLVKETKIVDSASGLIGEPIIEVIKDDIH